jgi:thiamine transporter ThiT
MEWYHYVSGFWAGAFIANFIPHFVHGASGKTFTTPFARPGGIGPSSPAVNVIWGLINLVIGYILLRAGHITVDCGLPLLTCFAGFSLMGLFASKVLARQYNYTMENNGK